MSTRQGSASYTIVIGAIAALVVGGLMLTFLAYPILTSFIDAGLFTGAETAPGARWHTLSKAVGTFWGAIVLLAILSFVWIRTRQ